MKVLVDEMPTYKSDCVFSKYSKKQYDCKLKDKNNNYCELSNGYCPYLKKEDDL